MKDFYRIILWILSGVLIVNLTLASPLTLGNKFDAGFVVIISTVGAAIGPFSLIFPLVDLLANTNYCVYHCEDK